LVYYNTIFCGFYTQDMTNPAMVDDPAKDPQYSEPNIDSLRSQKDEVSLCVQFK